ncbi:MAG TPA: S8 family serine peptidase [Chitinophagales bacterium]|nr:S8 family serine peptidase [Chitinophagales bacterium]HNK96606.1 S8 family serine peptidase [Chitinophagales bacterium]HNM28926.1 S8 family serine peptidase [Chitinophagales bacterium]
MAIKIVNDSNLKMHTRYTTEQGTGMVPLLKPINFLGPKPTGTKIDVPVEVADLAVHNATKIFNVTGTGLDGEGSVLAVLDTGIYAEHPDFGARVILSMNYKGEKLPTSDIHDLHGHGTHVAGLAAAGRSKALAKFSGIAPKAKIVSVKVTEGNEDTTTWKRIADGLDQVLNYNADAGTKPYNKVSCVLICFNSFDNFNNANEFDTTNNRLMKLFKICCESNIVVVVSSGNHFIDFADVSSRTITDGFGKKHKTPQVLEHTGLAFPAVSQHIICAGATANDDGIYYVSRSDLGDTVSFQKDDMAIFTQRIRKETNDTSNLSLFVAVPGLQMVSLDNRPIQHAVLPGQYPQGYTVMSGTSQAAGVLAGMVLLLQQKIRNKLHIHESCVPIQKIFTALKSTGEERNFDGFGHTVQPPTSTTHAAIGGLKGAHSPFRNFRIFDLIKAINYIQNH